MTADGFRFTDLDAHIRDVTEQVEVPMRRATDAGRPLDLLSYGIVGQAFTAEAAVTAADGSSAVAALADEAVAIAERLRVTQASYRRAEQDVRAELGLPS